MNEPSAPIVRLKSVVINVSDFEGQKAFWAELLGTVVAEEVAPYFAWLAPQQRDGVGVAIQWVADPTPGRRRLHIDAQVDDLEAATARIVELGGTHIEDHDVAGHSWRVMQDPEGNEFCIAGP